MGSTSIAVVAGAITFDNGTVVVGGIIGGIVPVAARKSWDRTTGAYVEHPFTFSIVGAFPKSITRNGGAPADSTTTRPWETASIARAIGAVVPTNPDGSPNLSGITLESIAPLPAWRDLRVEISRHALAYEPVDFLFPVAPAVAGVVTLTPDDKVRADAMAKIAAARKAR